MNDKRRYRAPQRSITALRGLIDEAKRVSNDLREPALTTWKTKVSGVLESAFGEDTTYWGGFWKVRYAPSLWTDSTDPNAYRVAGVARAVGIIEAAIYQLEIESQEEIPIEQSNEDTYDAGLWSHVRTAFEKEEWTTVAMLVAQYVEHYIREWSELDEEFADKPLVGKDLAARAFAEAGPLRLGRAKSEVEGWRALAMGFMQALSNVDRHRIQARPDSKRYALGVLGTGSLLLTQIRYQHPEVGL